MEEEKKKLHNNSTKVSKIPSPILAQCSLLLLLPFQIYIFTKAEAFNYSDALNKSLLYFESQRSGRLPYNQRVTWRDHSGLTDGLEQGVRGQISPLYKSNCPKCPKTLFFYLFIYIFYYVYKICT